MNKIYLSVAMSAAFAIGGCASQPKNIAAQSVSTVQYSNYSCQQVSMEADSVSTRVNELYGTLKQKADNDAVQMGVGLVLFWPTLFLLEGGDGPEAQEYAHLKGEHDALEKVAIQKECAAGSVAKLKTPDEFQAEQKAKSDAEGSKDS